MHLTLLFALGMIGVLGGTPAPDERQCVAVGKLDSQTGRFELIGSGLLVTPKLVLTQGYIRDVLEASKDPAVFYGPKVGEDGQILRVDRFIGSPEQSADFPGSTLCLLVLKGEIEDSDAHTRPFATKETIDAAKSLKVVGFGANDSDGVWGVGVRRMALIPIAINNGATRPDARERFGCRAGELVAIGAAGHDTANGDGGGPAFIQTDEGWLVAGLTSRAIKTTTRLSGDGGIYTRLDGYAEWIKSAAQEISPHESPLHSMSAGAVSIRRTPGVRGRPGPIAKNARSIIQSQAYIANVRDLADKTKGARVAGATNTAGFPDCVAVGDGNGTFFATGTLIAPQLVITAGHAYSLGIGEILIGDDFRHPEEAVARIKVKKAILHPSFKADDDPDEPRFVNDLTILVLERAVTPKEALPREIASAKAITAVKSVMVAGFGSNGDLTAVGGGTGPKRAVEISVASSDCSGMTDGITDQQAFGCNAGKELVAADPLRKKDSCRGDSGGPVYVKDGGKWAVAAATSRGTKRNGTDLDENGLALECGLGGIYVRIDKEVNWILEVAGKNRVTPP